MALRLARFNTLIDVEDEYPFTKEFFVGVPAPAAALVAGIPLYRALHFGAGLVVDAGWSSACGRCSSAGLMVSRLPDAVVQDRAGVARLRRPAAGAGRRWRRRCWSRCRSSGWPWWPPATCADPLHRLPAPLAGPPPRGLERAGARAARGGQGGPLGAPARAAAAAAPPGGGPGRARWPARCAGSATSPAGTASAAARQRPGPRAGPAPQRSGASATASGSGLRRARRR